MLRIFLPILFATSLFHALALGTRLGDSENAILELESNSISISIKRSNRRKPVKNSGKEVVKSESMDVEKESVQMTRVISEATARGNIKPEYPYLSRLNNEEGTVKVKIIIEKDGSVSSSEIVKSSGFSRLDSEAKRIVEKAKFNPARLNGEEISSQKVLTFNFNLE